MKLLKYILFSIICTNTQAMPAPAGLIRGLINPLSVFRPNVSPVTQAIVLGSMQQDDSPKEGMYTVSTAQKQFDKMQYHEKMMTPFKKGTNAKDDKFLNFLLMNWKEITMLGVVVGWSIWAGYAQDHDVG